jgi:nucleoside-diphosphate-sugar epimerase
MPIETLLANSFGTYNMLVLAKKYSAKFLHLSTSAIYGEVKESGQVREDNPGIVNPVGPRSCYNEGKRFAESLVANFHTKEGVDTKIARVFNTFGPRMRLDDGRMIPDFINNALNNKTVSVYGAENEMGSYCFVEDLIDGVTRLMASELNLPVNLGSDHPIYVGELAKKIVELCGSTSTLEFKEHLPYTSSQIIPDISLAKESLGWFPMISLIDGLAKTIENMKVHLREYRG